MSDIQKIRETRTKEDGGDWDEWPFPTVEIESVISGDLRSRILARFDRADDAGAVVTLIETEVCSGYSEFTQEDECSIQVKIGSEVAWQFAEYEYTGSPESAMARFLKEFG